MGKMLFGKTVYYRENNTYYPAIVKAISASEVGVVDLFVIGDKLPYYIRTSVWNGYGEYQWQHLELIPHDDNGMPILTDGPEMDVVGTADDLQEPASMFEVSFILFVGKGKATREDIRKAIQHKLDGAGLPGHANADLSLDGFAVKAVK